MANGFQYIDGIGPVTVSNGMVHIDLVAVRPAGAKDQKGRVEAVQHLVMTLLQFVRLCSEMSGHLKKMEEGGLITRQNVNSPAGRS